MLPRMEPESATFSGVKPLSAIGPMAVMSISLLKKAPTTWLIWFTFSSSVMSARSSFNFCSVIFLLHTSFLLYLLLQKPLKCQKNIVFPFFLNLILKFYHI